MIESYLAFTVFSDDDYSILVERIKNLFYIIEPADIDYTREIDKTEFWGSIENTEEIHPYINDKNEFILILYMERWRDAEEVLNEILNMNFPYLYKNIFTDKNYYSLELAPRLVITNMYPQITIKGYWEISY